MRRLRGRWRDSNPATKLRTEEIELRSSSMTTISASGNSDTILPLASSAAFTFLAGKTSLAPRLASTLAVSAPIPDVAPSPNEKKNHDSPENSFQRNKLKNMKKKLTGDYGCCGTKVTVLRYLIGGGLRAEAASTGDTDKVPSSLDHLFSARTTSLVFFSLERHTRRRK